MSQPESKLDQLLRQRAEIDDALRRHQTAFSVLFTDVVGSTDYFDRYGDIAGVAMLSRHETLARKCIEEQGGRVIKNIGDSVMAEFASPAVAVRAAVEIQRRLLRQNQTLPERERLQIRIGINHGTGFRNQGDVFGDVVNVAARITKKTGPAQILVSAAVKDAVQASGEFRCNFIGKIAMKGKAEEGEVYEVVWTDTHTYAGLRQNVTIALKRGDLMAPGLDPNELLESTPPPPPPDTAAEEAAPAPGALLAPVPPGLEVRYEILGELGRGGMGIVYKARDRETNDLVALKVLRPEVAADAKGMQRFKNELRVTRRITHKNVCRIHEFARTEGTAYISMEFVEGESLRHVLNRFGSLGLRKGIEIALQICAGLREAHAQGVVHRDLKPENVMLDAAGNVKIMDFGIAHAPLGAGLTQTHAVVGTPTYMAPEQAEGKPVDTRVDVYALGLILYEIFTGSQTFTAESPLAVAIKHMREAPVPPRQLDASIPEEINAAILKCLEKDPAARYQTVDELARALTGESLTMALEGIAPVAARTGEIPAESRPPEGVPSGAYHSPTPYAGSPPPPSPMQPLAQPPPPAVTVQAPVPMPMQPAGPPAVPAPAERAHLRMGMIVGAVLATGLFAAFVLVKVLREPARPAAPAPVTVETSAQQPVPLPAQTQPPASASSTQVPAAATAEPPAPAATSGPEGPGPAPARASAPPKTAAAEPAPPPVVAVSVNFSFSRALAGHTGAVSSVAFSGDGRLVATGSRDKTVRVWEAGTGRSVHILKGHKDAVSAVAFSPDGRLVASGSVDRTITIWDTGSGQAIVTLPRETAFVLSVAFSPDGSLLAASLSDGRIKLWDASSGQGIQTFEGHAGPVYSVVFSPDGRWLASAGRDQTVRLWNASSGQQVREFRGHSDAVNTVAFSPDGRWLASASDDKTARLWEAATGRELRAFSGHAGAVDGVAFGSDGRWLATGSEDKTVRVWNTSTGEELASLSGHIYAITDLASTRNGRILASAAGDNTVRLWRRE